MDSFEMFGNKDRKSGNSTICRDFLRNTCYRGDQCKYSHPKGMEQPQKKIFCHDFQNGECKRGKICKFIHCSKEDESRYRATGQLETDLKNTTHNLENASKSSCERDCCRQEYINDRESSAKRTISPTAYNRGYCLDYEDVKRRRCHNGGAGTCEGPHNCSLWSLENENEMLLHKLSDMKKKVDDLQATNEFLLEQNARMRLSLGDKTMTAVCTVPTVTITNTQQQCGQQPQMMATVPVSLAAVATPVSLATVSMAPVQIPHDTIATVPVSLAAVGAPVSLATVSMAPVQIPRDTVAVVPSSIAATLSESSHMVLSPIINTPAIGLQSLPHH